MIPLTHPSLPWREKKSLKGKYKADPILAVALRNWNVGVDSSHWETEVAAAIDNFLENHLSGHAIFVPFQELNEELLDDFGLAERILQKVEKLLQGECS